VKAARTGHLTSQSLQTRSVEAKSRAGILNKKRGIPVPAFMYYQAAAVSKSSCRNKCLLLVLLQAAREVFPAIIWWRTSLTNFKHP
jgi:hypothetical protein